MKLALFAYIIISATALTRYDFSNQSNSKRAGYYKCIKHAKVPAIPNDIYNSLFIT